MKKSNNIIYWTTTILVSLSFFMSAGMYLTKNPELLKGFEQIGFPLVFVAILGVAKLLGAIGLLIPKWKIANEWAYAGFTFVLIGATWVHIATATPFMAPLVILAILGVSYWFRGKRVDG